MKLRHANTVFLALVIGISIPSFVYGAPRKRSRVVTGGKQVNKINKLIEILNKNIMAIGAHIENINFRLERLEQGKGGTQQTASEEELSKLKQDVSNINGKLTSMEDDVDGIVGEQDKIRSDIKQNRLNWSGSFRTTLNTFHLRDTSVVRSMKYIKLDVDGSGMPIIDPVTHQPKAHPVYSKKHRNIDNWYGNSWVNRQRLTMTWNITDNLRFYGRIAIFKYLNDLKSHPVTLDMHSSRYPRDTTLRLERAYIDWFITDWLVLSAGRITAPEGPPAELKENTVRSATWGVQMIEAEMECINLTIHMSKLIPDSYLRLFYIPFTSHTDFSLSDDLAVFQDAGIESMQVFGGMLELKIPKLGKNLVQLSLTMIPTFRPRNMAIQYPGIEDPIYPIEPTSQDLGFYAFSAVLVELIDVFDIGLDLFAAYELNTIDPSEGRMQYIIPIDVPVYHPMTGYTGKTVQPTYQIGLASYDDEKPGTHTGHMFYTGFRYTFPFLGKYAPRIGFEYNQGSKYHIAWASISDLLINKLAVKGNAIECYWIQQLIPDALFARIGYLRVKRDYEGLYIGPTIAVNQVITNTYILMDAHW